MNPSRQHILSFVRMCWVAIFLLWFMGACGQPSIKSSSPTPTSHLPQNNTLLPPSPVEQQLMATVKNAEQLGPGNPLLLSSLYSLATYYEDRQAYDKAADQYRRALQLKEEATGPNHPDVAAILQRYGRLLQKANRHSEAQKLLLRADAILANSPSSLPRQ